MLLRVGAVEGALEDEEALGNMREQALRFSNPVLENLQKVGVGRARVFERVKERVREILCVCVRSGRWGRVGAGAQGSDSRQALHQVTGCSLAGSRGCGKEGGGGLCTPGGR